jgi:hypothetical protein
MLRCYTGTFNAACFIEKLKAFMRYLRRPVFLVGDGHPAHRAKIVAAYAQSLKGRLEATHMATSEGRLGHPDANALGEASNITRDA